MYLERAGRLHEQQVDALVMEQGNQLSRPAVHDPLNAAEKDSRIFLGGDEAASAVMDADRGILPGRVRVSVFEVRLWRSMVSAGVLALHDNSLVWRSAAKMGLDYADWSAYDTLF
jgi:hypothetical protein